MNIEFYMSFFVLLIYFCYKHKHLLLLLLLLEYFIIILFLMLMNYLIFFNMELFFGIIYLVFVVCESVLGLSILVSYIRFFGDDMLLSMNMMW
uniref:NADH dehydrogenase subunit 4L n=1 Tax=Oncylocotis sp. PJ-2015 TaxID=1663423 RepID=A0A342D263_9HEMI|nr:NADH dehydrogenase subunit 4L [Oncylocotis sp. PJ-2015]